MNVYVATADTMEEPFMIVSGPGISRTLFELMVKERLADESLPNPDNGVNRLTLTEYGLDHFAASIIDPMGVEAGNEWVDLVWTYPGQWVTLGVGEREPVPAEFRSSTLDPADGYDPSDPKHPDYHDTMSGLWDERTKG